MDNYEVWVDDGAGNFGSSATLAPAATDATAIITGRTLGEEYGIKMRAVNAAGPGAVGPSEFSDVVYLVCGDKPAAPAAPTAETSKNSIALAWAAPAASGGSLVTGYSIYINDLSVGDWKLAYAGEGYPTRQVYVINGLVPGQAYRFKVAAHNKVGSSANSTEATFIASDRPAAPT